MLTKKSDDPLEFIGGEKLLGVKGWERTCISAASRSSPERSATPSRLTAYIVPCSGFSRPLKVSFGSQSFSLNVAAFLAKALSLMPISKEK